MSEWFRAEFWYVFGIAALVVLGLRLRHTRLKDLADPMALSFTLLIALASFGTLTKQPFIADFVDARLGPNAAWLMADVLFICGLCAGTYWTDFVGKPSLREKGWGLLIRWRMLGLGAAVAWMVSMTLLDWSTWTGLERGTIATGGSLLILSSRLAYFAFSLFGLGYMAYSFYGHRQRMQDRSFYVRLTIPWVAIMLAIPASAVQAVAAVEVYLWPELLPLIWPAVWQLVTGLQAVFALLIVATFVPPAYRAVIWLDKQLLVRRLLWVRRAISQTRPDLLEPEPPLGQPGLIVRQPDRWLTSLVSEIELAKGVIGRPQYQQALTAPAGMAMPDAARLALREEQVQFMTGLASQRPVDVPQVTGNFYALARWYAALRV